MLNNYILKMKTSNVAKDIGLTSHLRWIRMLYKAHA